MRLQSDRSRTYVARLLQITIANAGPTAIIGVTVSVVSSPGWALDSGANLPFTTAGNTSTITLPTVVQSGSSRVVVARMRATSSVVPRSTLTASITASYRGLSTAAKSVRARVV
jgi:hypothetical protein